MTRRRVEIIYKYIYTNISWKSKARISPFLGIINFFNPIGFYCNLKLCTKFLFQQFFVSHNGIFLVERMHFRLEKSFFSKCFSKLFLQTNKKSPTQKSQLWTLPKIFYLLNKSWHLSLIVGDISIYLHKWIHVTI